MKLLIVNDAIVEAQTMKTMIPWSQYGIDEVFLAFNAQEGREILLKQTIDILLCDIEMPGESGISLIRWIREQGYDIDIILLTCHAEFTYAREAVALNCQDYILLPAKYDDIGKNVKKIADRRVEHLEHLQLQKYGENWIKSQQNELKPTVPFKSSTELVNECVEYIQENLGDENLSVSQVASHFYLNAIYLNRIFKKEKKVNLSKWIIQERMELAAQLLKSSEYTAAAVASRVGYSNYPYFSTTFKKYFGCTPSQYLDTTNQESS